MAALNSGKLHGAGLAVPNVDSQILPVRLGDPRRAAAVAERLLERGFYLAAIRPPTVPQGTSRLRLSLMATHTESEIAQLAEALVECAHAASAASAASPERGPSTPRAPRPRVSQPRVFPNGGRPFPVE